jgi:hypothetical protein
MYVCVLETVSFSEVSPTKYVTEINWWAAAAEERRPKIRPTVRDIKQRTKHTERYI